MVRLQERILMANNEIFKKELLIPGNSFYIIQGCGWVGGWEEAPRGPDK